MGARADDMLLVPVGGQGDALAPLMRGHVV